VVLKLKGLNTSITLSDHKNILFLGFLKGLNIESFFGAIVWTCLDIQIYDKKNRKSFHQKKSCIFSDFLEKNDLLIDYP